MNRSKLKDNPESALLSEKETMRKVTDRRDNLKMPEPIIVYISSPVDTAGLFYYLEGKRASHLPSKGNAHGKTD
jgi:hypothetical protein